ncbi:heavy metal-binding domain-containing protein [Luteolibacter algae]|uniref:Heavy metal-binding domain-containing protein n=1 Tax=Luteolibacter algae TaxID=454151 RepID=A0ABW5D6B9_9BACT
MIDITCPICSDGIKIPDQYINRTIKCVSCGARFEAVEGDEPRHAKSKVCYDCGENTENIGYGSNLLLTSEKNAVINEYHSEKVAQRCKKCGEELYERYREQLITERENLAERFREELQFIPIVSLHSPINWDYSVLELVTAQSTTGTGVFSEITSAVTDLFGTQSKAYNRKIKAGENTCKSILRKETFDLGGNAILAADVDYSEVGGSKGMLMVTMTGTAVLLNNPEILTKDAARAFSVKCWSEGETRSFRTV